MTNIIRLKWMRREPHRRPIKPTACLLFLSCRPGKAKYDLRQFAACFIPMYNQAKPPAALACEIGWLPTASQEYLADFFVDNLTMGVPLRWDGRTRMSNSDWIMPSNRTTKTVITIVRQNESNSNSSRESFQTIPHRQPEW